MTDGQEPLLQLAELADLTLHVARKLRGYPLQNPEVVPLSPMECLVLLHVNRNPGVAPSRLAQDLALTSSNTAAAVRGLAGKGLMDRRADPSDRRGACLYLTEDAERAIVTVHRTWTDLLRGLELSDDDVLTTVRTLAAIEAALGEP